MPDEDSIELSVHLPTSIDQAWNFLTVREHVSNWWGGHVFLEPWSGGVFQERWSNGEREIFTSGIVRRCMRPQELELTWSDDDWPDSTLLRFQLSEEAGRTILHLRHSNWRIHPEDRRQRLMADHASGWSHHLRSLREYVISRERTDETYNSHR